MFGWFWSNPASPPLRFSSLYINVVQRWQTGGSNCWVLICLSSPTHWHRHNGYCQELLVGAWLCISAPASYSSCQHYRPRAQTLQVNLMTRSAFPVKYISLISQIYLCSLPINPQHLWQDRRQSYFPRFQIKTLCVWFRNFRKYLAIF